MHHIQPADRQQFTFANRLDDFISSHHWVRLLDTMVERIISENPEDFIDKGRANIGRRAYSPQTFLKLYLYGYLNGLKSSRKLEQETHRNLEVMWLLGNLKPDHKTISEYRRRNKDQIKKLSKKFREFLRDNEFITGEQMVLDGTRVKAYANRDMLTLRKIEKRLVRIQDQMDGYLQILEENDILEDLEEEFGGNFKEGGEVNRELLRRISELQEKIEVLEEQKAFLEEQHRHDVSPADPDARLMKSRDGFIPGYNVQLVVDRKHKMIANVEVLTNPSDENLLECAVDSLKEELNITPKEIIADRGYYNLVQIESLENRKEAVDCYVAIKKTKEEKTPAVEFYYDEEQDECRCSQGGRLPLKQKGKIYKVYQGIDCDSCAIRSQCTRSKKGRILKRRINQHWQNKYRRKLEGPAGKTRMKIRRNVVEHPIGTLRYWMGKIPILLRGQEKVATEFHIYMTSYDLKRLTRIKGFDDIMEMLENYRWKLA